MDLRSGTSTSSLARRQTLLARLLLPKRRKTQALVFSRSRKSPMNRMGLTVWPSPNLSQSLITETLKKQGSLQDVAEADQNQPNGLRKHLLQKLWEIHDSRFTRQSLRSTWLTKRSSRELQRGKLPLPRKILIFIPKAPALLRR